MNADSLRNASIVADEETDLLIINRDLFNGSLKVNIPILPILSGTFAKVTAPPNIVLRNF